MTTTLDKDTYPIESGYKQRTNSILLVWKLAGRVCYI